MQKYRDPRSGMLYGYSKWFKNDGNFEWRRCLVVGYDEKEERYIAEWATGKNKLVSRVNLRFERYSITSKNIIIIIIINSGIHIVFYYFIYSRE